MESFVNDNIPSEAESADDIPVEIPNPQKKRKRQSKSSSTVSNTNTSLGGRRRSQYLDHFEPSGVQDKLKCMYCPRIMTYKPGNGTSALKSHLDRCPKYPANLDRKQKLIQFESKTIVNEDGTTEVVNVPKLWKFDPEDSRRKCAKMIIVDELPFAHVEGEGFREFVASLCPEYISPSRSTVTRDCYSLFIEEREKLKVFFGKLSSRVCLTTDTWTSSQNLCYMCLTAHFIDDNWNLHKRIINFCLIAGHSGELLGRSIEQCLIEWDLKRVLTCTVDNASANDLAIQYLQRRVNFWKGSVLDGKYMHMRCAAHILNLVVKDGLKDVHLSIIRIRSAVRFVRSSPARSKSFKKSIKEVGGSSKRLVPLDVETRWNSTYLMLQSALKFKEAFDNLNSKGGAYTRHLAKKHGAPTDNDWEAVKTFLPFLEIFYHATLKVSGSLHVTSNVYVPEIVGVSSLISSFCEDENENIRNMATKMKKKHDKYWADADNINILLFIATILDPRQKWVFVEWAVKDTFYENNANLILVTIKKCLKSLFECYDTSNSSLGSDIGEANSTTSASSSIDHDLGGVKSLDAQQILMTRFRKEKGASCVEEKKTELDRYLSDVVEDHDPKFDLLGWWKDCSKRRYPILAKMARDLLAMPVSTVASESAFSTGGRVLDKFRTSLTPRIVEALICCQDWLRKSRGPLIIEENLNELEELEESKHFNQLVICIAFHN